MTLLTNAAGLAFECLEHGALRRMGAGPLWVNAHPGNALEGGPMNLWLRHRMPGREWVQTPLLGPGSPLAFSYRERQADGRGPWQGLDLHLQLRLAETQTAWFWHLHVHAQDAGAGECEWLLVQDLGLAAPGSVRLNEYYISHYLDLQPLNHPRLGWALAARQNQPQAGGQHPWLLAAGLHRTNAYATDAAQVFGLALRSGSAPALHLPAQRLQHEHAVAALQQPLQPDGDTLCGGFVLAVQAHHPEASGPADLALLDPLLALPEARATAATGTADPAPPAPSLFASAPLLPALDLPEDDPWLPAERRHIERNTERDGDGTLLAFFHGEDAHTVLRAKELRAARPHGHILRAGLHAVPDETALTSTCWMGGVFHSMLTQGHVSANRLLSAQRSLLGLFRSQGLRVFINTGSGWALLGTPSAFEMRPHACRWLYAHAQGRLELTASAGADPRQMQLSARVLQGPPCDFLLSLHLALDGDDGLGEATAALLTRVDAHTLHIAPPAGSAMAERFAGGHFRLSLDAAPEAIGTDALLYPDGRSRGESVLALRLPTSAQWTLRVKGALLPDAPQPAHPLPLPRWQPAGPQEGLQQLISLQPWLLHNALVHYLSPRGLEQFNGGGWGTRDVAQGPLELLLSLGQFAPARDLLLRLFAAQISEGPNKGDWPQWFMFFARDAHIRAGDQHGDIVLWPLLALAQYLLASGDATLLDEPLPAGHTVSEATQQALALIRQRVVPGHVLPAYWHGDWNDSLQPADPALRDRLCSAWTVTLHHQTLHTLAQALQTVGRPDPALAPEAETVAAAFHRDLLQGGVVAGYAHYAHEGQPPQLWLHPSDTQTGLRYSLLPMMHAVLANLLSPADAARQAALIEQHLKGPDGARLFDAPLPYQGGRMQRFQRAETSSFFGREIGVMYMHAHLRYAQMLAHLGHTNAFIAALAQAHAIGLRERLPVATLRQSNCYTSSSDGAFPDRYTAHHDYAKLLAGDVPLDAGWRIYSSGPGIALSLLIQHLLGLRLQGQTLLLDPVLPAALNGLQVEMPLADFHLSLHYAPGPQGCGVTQVERLLDNGTALPLRFERHSHPYRTGPAALPRPPTGEHWRLRIHTD